MKALRSLAPWTARTLTGAVGEASPATPALHLASGAAFEAGEWAEARLLGREALGLIEEGAVRAEASVVPALAWQGFVAPGDRSSHCRGVMIRALSSAADAGERLFEFALKR